MDLVSLIEKYTALAEEEPTEFWDAADWAYHYAYQEILRDLTQGEVLS